MSARSGYGLAGPPVAAAPSAIPPMSEAERDALLRLQFCLSNANFREVLEVGGQQLYSEYTEGTVDPVAAAIEAEIAAQEQAEKAPEKAVPKQGTPAYDKWLADEAERQLSGARTGESISEKARLRMQATEGSRERPQATMSTEEIVAKHVENNDLMRRDLLTLHGAMEFIRSGNQDALPPVLKRDWRRLEADPSLGGYAGRAWGQLTSANSMVRDGARTWNDFLINMTAKLPSTRRTVSAQDKVAKRLASAHTRAELTASGLYGSDPTTLGVNPFARRLVDDDFRPPSPTEWNPATSGSDKKEIEEWDKRRREGLKNGFTAPVGLPFGKPAEQGRFSESAGSPAASRLLSSSASALGARAEQNA